MSSSENKTKDWISTKEAAERLGVSLSTFKRMCNANSFVVAKTPGGHRRIDKAQFAIASQIAYKQRVDCDVNVLDTEEIVRHLLNADYLQLTDRMFRLAPTLKGQIRFIEDFFVPALWRIGDLWQSSKLTIAEEKVCTSTAALVLDGLAARFVMPSFGSRLFVGATFTQSNDTLASKILVIALMSIGIRPVYLGCNIAPEFIAEVARIHAAEAVWISHTHITDLAKAVADHETLSRLLPIGTRVIVGGGGLSPSARRSLTGCIYYESIDQLIENEQKRTIN